MSQIHAGTIQNMTLKKIYFTREKSVRSCRLGHMLFLYLSAHKKYSVEVKIYSSFPLPPPSCFSYNLLGSPTHTLRQVIILALTVKKLISTIPSLFFSREATLKKHPRKKKWWAPPFSVTRACSMSRKLRLSQK